MGATEDDHGPRPSREPRPHPDEVWPPYRKGDSLPGAGVFAMGIFVVSLGIMFFVCLIGYASMRAGNVVWPPPGAPETPGILWWSTGLIVATSITVHLGLRAVRHEEQRSLCALMLATLLLGTAFVVCQGYAWAEIAPVHDPALWGGKPEDVPGAIRQYAGSFYLLTGLHGLHVVGGLALQVWVTLRAFKGGYRYYHHAGVTYSVIYWHFLDIVWLVVFVTLLLGNA